ncbi:MAG TPA: DEAD/DEAH box helicase [Phycisphaerae bacterium]|nr:DEAD/DEAH box helicase [Phycisphaerae bacterium]
MALQHFHPTIERWFRERLGEPTTVQSEAWEHIRHGRNTLVAAPTGTGKTLAAFLWAVDELARAGESLGDETRVLYVSPLRALSNDIQKNLSGPLRELAERDSTLADIRVLVRTGDTTARDRASMVRKPPHILVTTPESLYILLTSAGGRGMLKTVRTVIVDEIHALTRDKRGSHLSISLERLEDLTERHRGTEAQRHKGGDGLQRIGLSATQRPLSDVAKFLVGVGRECELVDIGHRREMDIGIEVPPSALTNVCAHEQWDEIYGRIAELINEHRTTLVFVNTRKMAERIAARLSKVMGEDVVTCHHSSLSKERRLDAEQRLKAGTLRALVATASLELGIDIGDVDLVIQIGSTHSIATFLQRVGRAGHAVERTPRGRFFPLTIDELVEGAALFRAVKRGELDRTLQPAAPLDILSQQIVAACAAEGEQGWEEDRLFELYTRATPYRDLARSDFDSVIKMMSEGRRSLLHRDGVGGRLMGRRRARIAAITGGGAIADVADYRVVQDPDGTTIGSLNEDFAVEANVGDIVQLGNTSWRILKVESGTVRVADAKGQPPTIPFWLGEGPSRTTELSRNVGELLEEADDPAVLRREIGLSEEAAVQIAEYVREGRRILGTVPTQKRVILERFFDESGGMQMVLHSPFGGRINRAWGLALRKRFCRGFGFELQAAANEDAIVISLGPQHSFPLVDVFDYLKAETVREILTQAVLDQPMFESRWRWNATRSLMLDKFQHGRAVPPPILRMRAGDLLAASFPAAVACPENLPAGDLPIPMDHPLVRQTIYDCLTEATDVKGLIRVLRDLRDGRIEKVAVDTPEPSSFARSILSSQPYSFLDDAPLEERRTQAVINRRALDLKSAEELGALDPDAVERVRQEAWPSPETAEEVHEALQWMGFVMDQEAGPWLGWLVELANQRRVVHEHGRWFAVDASREAKKVLLGRLEALGPVFEGDPRVSLTDGDANETLRALECDGAILRTRLDGQTAWCERRLLARIHRYTIERLRREIEPVSATQFMQFLGCWQHEQENYRLEGPRGVAEVLRQLAGLEIAAAEWEKEILPRRVRDYRREWLDELTLSGEFAWGRLWGASACPIRITPISFVLREELDEWLGFGADAQPEELRGPGRDLHDALAARGPMFPQELAKWAKLVPAHVEMGLADLVSHGLATCDSFAAIRQLITPPSKRKRAVHSVGRWSLLRTGEKTATQNKEMLARQLLKRTGIVFRKTIARERLPIAWSGLCRIYRLMELRGEVRGGRFVAGFSGEQFALPEAVDLVRKIRREPPAEIESELLGLREVLTPETPASSRPERDVMAV